VRGLNPSAPLEICGMKMKEEASKPVIFRKVSTG
jgi:hypothetical protein